ncbi:MAG: serine hydrolase, partial [Clostridiales bacterium]|nr:serine hydrolase [Clostridiales bacterium]
MPRKIFAIILALAASLAVLALPLSAAYLEAPNAPDTGYARAVLLKHMESGTILYSKNADSELYPASTVKLMTAVLAAEKFAGRLDTEVTVSEKAVQGIGGNYIALQPGEVTTVQALINAMIIGGANDAAMVLSEAVSGTTEEFVARMNERAAELGCDSTVYMNPTGIDVQGAHTTASDVARLAEFASQMEAIADVADDVTYVMPATNMSPERTIRNRNYFISTALTDAYRRSDVNGLNCGSSAGGGSTLVATADDGSFSYLCVVLGASTDSNYIYSYVICSNLLDWAYRSYGYSAVISSSKLVCEIPVTMSDGADYVVLSPKDDIDLFMPNNFDVSKDVNIDWTLDEESLTAPVEEGQRAGMLVVYDLRTGDVIGQSELVAVTHVDRSELKYRLWQLLSFFTSPTFL